MPSTVREWNYICIHFLQPDFFYALVWTTKSHTKTEKKFHAEHLSWCLKKVLFELEISSQQSSENLLFFPHKRKKKLVWNNMREGKWWQNFHSTVSLSWFKSGTGCGQISCSASLQCHFHSLTVINKPQMCGTTTSATHPHSQIELHAHNLHT